MLSVWFTLRQLWRSPAHIAAVVLSLGIGMAVCAAVFSVLNGFLFAAVPGIVDRQSMIHIRWMGGNERLTHSEFETVNRDLTPALVAVVAQGERHLPVLLPSGPLTTTVAFVSGNLFEALGTVAVQGRLLTRGDAAETVVISESLWRRHYSADPAVVGQTIVVTGRPFLVVGISPSGFPGLRLSDPGSDPGSMPQLWVPLMSGGADAPWLTVGGRLPPNADLNTLQARLSVTSTRLAQQSPVRREPAVLRWFRAGLSWTDNPWGSLATVALVLIVPLSILAIGCANMINLQLARATERTQELSVRLTLGATRMQLVRLLSIEAVLLTALAAVVGGVGARLLLASVQPLFAAPLSLDPTVLWFLLILVAGVVAAAGSAPAWLALRQVIAVGVKQATDSVPHKRLRSALVVVQVAGSVVLLFISGLGLRSLQAQHATLPAHADDILTAPFDLSQVRQPAPSSAVFVDGILTELRDRGPTRTAAFATFLRYGQPVRFWLAADDDAVRRMVYGGAVTRAWFDVMGIRLRAGRGFDDAHAGTDLVVNEAFASQLGGQSAVLGTRLRLTGLDGALRTGEIVGVVEDQLMLSVPMALFPMPAMPPASLVLAVRTTDVTTALPIVRAAIHTAEPLAPVDRIRPLSASVQEVFSGLENVVQLGVTLAVMAVVLAAVGEYAVLAFVVRRRTREIGIRIAVGAARLSVLRLVVRQALAVTLAGLVLGFCLAVPIGIALRSALFGVSPVDPLAMMPVAMAMLLVGLAASVLPALRATRVDPVVALRDE